MNKTALIKQSLDCLDWGDMFIILDTFQKMTEEVMSSEKEPPIWSNTKEQYYSEALRRFKSEKLNSLDACELIESYLKIRVITNGKTNIDSFSINFAQKDLLRQINSEAGVVYPKYRLDGITTILAAFIALKSYLAKTRTVIINSGQMNRHFREKLGDFLEQTDAYFKLKPDGVVLYNQRNTNTFKLFNGSCIYFVSDSSASACRGIGDIDYVIFDECDFIKNMRELSLEAEIITKSNHGKIIRTYTIADRKREDFGNEEK